MRKLCIALLFCAVGLNAQRHPIGLPAQGSVSNNGTSLTTNKLTKASGGTTLADSSITDNGTTVATAEPVLAGDGSAGSNSGLGFAGEATTGFVRPGAGEVWMQTGGTSAWRWVVNVFNGPSGGVIGFASGAIGNAVDTGISRDAAGAIDIGTGAAASKAGTINATTANFTGVTSIGSLTPLSNAATSAFNTTQSNVSILASAAAQTYHIGYSIYESTAGSGGTCSTNATVTPAITWTDPGNQARTFTAGAISLTPTITAGTMAASCAAATGAGGCEVVAAVKAASAITVTYTFANGNCSTQPKATALAWAY